MQAVLSITSSRPLHAVPPIISSNIISSFAHCKQSNRSTKIASDPAHASSHSKKSIANNQIITVPSHAGSQMQNASSLSDTQSHPLPAIPFLASSRIEDSSAVQHKQPNCVAKLQAFPSSTSNQIARRVLSLASKATPRAIWSLASNNIASSLKVFRPSKIALLQKIQSIASNQNCKHFYSRISGIQTQNASSSIHRQQYWPLSAATL